MANILPGHVPVCDFTPQISDWYIRFEAVLIYRAKERLHITSHEWKEKYAALCENFVTKHMFVLEMFFEEKAHLDIQRKKIIIDRVQDILCLAE